MRVRLTLLLALGLPVTACTSYHYDRLAPLDEIEELSALSRRSRKLPLVEGRVEVGRTGDGVPIHLAYVESPPRSDWLVVMIHGLLASHRSWEFMAAEIASEHDLLLVDLLGCGRSDKPDPSVHGERLYSPESSARFVLAALRDRLAARGDRLAARGDRPNVAIVGHSLGGMVALRMLGSPALRSEFPDEVEAIRRAVLIAPVDFAVEKKHPGFERLAKLSTFELRVASASGILRELVAERMQEEMTDPHRMPRELADRRVAILGDDRQRAAAQAMIRQAVPFDANERPDWDAIERLVRDYGNVSAPTLILWGARDETFGVAMGYKLRAQLPDARLHVLPGRKHSLQSEAPAECSRAVLWFVRTAGRGSPVVVDGAVEPRGEMLGE